MNQAFSRLFWGYLFVWLEIHILVIDLLADPVGYYLIFSGITLLLKDYPIGQKARKLSLALVFISIPSVFVQQNTGTDSLGQLSFLSGWSIYMIVLGVLKIILVFYIFQLIMAVVQKYSDEERIRRSSRTFFMYITVMLLATISNSFMINFSGYGITAITIITIIMSLIMDIVFLILLLSLRKIHPEGMNGQGDK